jgi:hypothetical protein
MEPLDLDSDEPAKTIEGLFETMRRNDNALCDFLLSGLLRMGDKKSNVDVEGSLDERTRESWRRMKESTGVTDDDFVLSKKLKYTLEELEEIEDRVDELFPQGHVPQATTIIPFGFYLGELLRKKIPGAEWNFDPKRNAPEDLLEMSIKFTTSNGGVGHAKPFTRASKFWDNREDKMSTFVKMIEFNSEVELDPAYWSKRADDDGWIEMPNEMKFRFFVGEKSNGNITNGKGMFHDGNYEQRNGKEDNETI